MHPTADSANREGLAYSIHVGIARNSEVSLANRIRFDADEISLDATTGFIGFASDENYFWMQPGEESYAKDQIWLERDDQAWGGSGGAWKVTLYRDVFLIDTQTCGWLKCDAIEIAFDFDESRFAVLRSLLMKVMAECLGDLRIVEHNVTSSEQ